ncbi:DUF3298 domain-containing protein [Pseudomonas sp. UL073]|uniref:DUF3298 domain-containing protein n=1 Tax=Zestomonas insulae TaxID=2809017 RepID=A0ABS2IE08_9GAMM|nr:RsiV family protein [Pseudomonas insulae]MBM7061202.1 DUF3298 domain-containing protein [Pseudomonas insulae]
MRLVPLLLCTILTVPLLNGCQSLRLADNSLTPQRIAFEHSPAGCQGESCPLVNIDTLSFAEQPALNALIERSLLEMTVDGPGAPLPPSLQAYERNFLAEAQPGWSSYLQAKVREQHDGLLILELSSYLATGGAHGMPGRRFINYDRKLEKPLSLQDMLLPGQEDAFWKLAQDAHRRWLAAEKLDQDADYQKTWPFQETANVALTRGAVLLKYDVYSIAPYSSGHPELKIPYPQLNGVLKPQYFPGRG